MILQPDIDYFSTSSPHDTVVEGDPFATSGEIGDCCILCITNILTAVHSSRHISDKFIKECDPITHVPV